RCMKGCTTLQFRSLSSWGSGLTTIVARTISSRYSPSTSVGAMRTSYRRPSTLTFSTWDLSSVPLGAQPASTSATTATSRCGQAFLVAADIPRSDGALAEFLRHLAADIGEGLLHRRH